MTCTHLDTIDSELTRSFQPDESWVWCYVDQAALDAG